MSVYHGLNQYREKYKNNPDKIYQINEIVKTTPQIALPNWSSLPKVGEDPIDIVEVRRRVVKNGGFHKVCADKNGWAGILNSMNLHAAPNYIEQLKLHYQSLILPYDDDCGSAKRNTAELQAKGVAADFQASKRPRVYIDQQSGQQHQLQSQFMTSNAALGAGIVRTPTMSSSSSSSIGLEQATFPRFETISEAVGGLLSSDTHVIVKALNTLTVQSINDRESFTLLFEKETNLLQNLTLLLDILNPLNVKQLISRGGSHENYYFLLLAQDKDRQFWPKWEYKLPQDEITLMRVIDDNHLLLCVLHLLRNMTLEAVNQSYLAYSLPCMRHIVALAMFDSIFDLPISEATRYSFEILSNVARFCDVTGRTRTQGNVYLLPMTHKLYHGKKQELKMSCSDQFSVKNSSQYSSLVVILMQLGLKIVAEAIDRERVYRGVDLINKLAQCPENGHYFSNAPVKLYDCLVSMLAVTYTSVDSITAYHGECERRNRVSASKTPTAFQDLIDNEVRDLALEALFSICQISTSCTEQIGSVPGCITLIRRCIKKGAENERFRSETAQRAAQLLILFSTRPQLSDILHSIMHDLQYEAMSDDLLLDVYVSFNSQEQAFKQDLYECDVTPVSSATEAGFV